VDEPETRDPAYVRTSLLAATAAGFVNAFCCFCRRIASILVFAGNHEVCQEEGIGCEYFEYGRQKGTGAFDNGVHTHPHAVCGLVPKKLVEGTSLTTRVGAARTTCSVRMSWPNACLVVW
jgi:hypothetical protein